MSVLRSHWAIVVSAVILGCTAEAPSPSPKPDPPTPPPCTAEEMNDCGGCGTSCDEGGTCRAGICEVPLTLASVHDPWSVARDGDFVYFTSYSATTGKVMLAPHDAVDESATVELARSQPHAWGIAVDAGDVFWTNAGPREGSVMKLESGGDPIELTGGLNQPEGIALDASNVYVTCVGSGSLVAVPRGGGDAVVLATDLGTPEALALDDEYAYVTDSRGGRLLRVPLDGGEPEVLASDLSMPAAIAVDESSAYFTTRGDGAVLKIPRDGGENPTLLARGFAPNGLALDETDVYFSDEGVEPETGTISSVPKNGGDIALVAGSQDEPWSIAVDDASVYWTNVGSGAVLRAAK